MDDGGGLGCFGAFGDGPGAGFFGSGGEVSLEAEEVVDSADEDLESGFFDPEAFQELSSVFIGEFDEFGFDLGGDDDNLVALFGGKFLNGFGPGVTAVDLVFADVGGVDHGFTGE